MQMHGLQNRTVLRMARVLARGARKEILHACCFSSFSSCKFSGVHWIQRVGSCPGTPGHVAVVPVVALSLAEASQTPAELVEQTASMEIFRSIALSVFSGGVRKKIHVRNSGKRPFISRADRISKRVYAFVNK